MSQTATATTASKPAHPASGQSAAAIARDIRTARENRATEARVNVEAMLERIFNEQPIDPAEFDRESAAAGLSPQQADRALADVGMLIAAKRKGERANRLREERLPEMQRLANEACKLRDELKAVHLPQIERAEKAASGALHEASALYSEITSLERQSREAMRLKADPSIDRRIHDFKQQRIALNNAMVGAAKDVPEPANVTANRQSIQTTAMSTHDRQSHRAMHEKAAAETEQQRLDQAQRHVAELERIDTEIVQLEREKSTPCFSAVLDRATGQAGGGIGLGEL